MVDRSAAALVAVLILSSCTAASPPSTNAAAVLGSSTQTSAVVSASTAQAPTPGASDPGGYCDAYLALLSAQDGAQYATSLAALRSALGPGGSAEALAALDTIESSDTSEAIRRAAGDLDRLSASICRDRYRRDVIGAASDTAAAQRFFDALVDGRRSDAVPLATSNVIAIFEPWQPLPEGPEHPALRIVGSEARMSLAPNVDVTCALDSEAVVSCVFDP